MPDTTPIHRTSVDLPPSLYAKLMHYKVDGLIRNLKTAIIEGLYLLVEEIERRER